MPNIMMDMNEERRRETTLNANLLLIRDKVDVLDLLDHLPCIHKMLRQKVECEFRNNGSHRAMEMLLNNLPGKDNWFEQLVSALRDLDEFELAEILDPCNTVQIIDHFSGVDQENIFQYPMKKAPYTLTSALKFMDYDGSWKEFAGHLGYTLEKIQKYEARPGKDGSHISRVMEHWCSNSDGTIGNIVCVLQKLERVDILENFSKILRIPLAQTEKKVTNDNDQQKNCSGPEESLTSSCKEDAIHEEQQIKAVKYSYHDFLSGNYDSGFDSMSSVDTNNPEKSLESLDSEFSENQTMVYDNCGGPVSDLTDSVLHFKDRFNVELNLVKRAQWTSSVCKEHICRQDGREINETTSTCHVEQNVHEHCLQKYEKIIPRYNPVTKYENSNWSTLKAYSPFLITFILVLWTCTLFQIT